MGGVDCCAAVPTHFSFKLERPRCCPGSGVRPSRAQMCKFSLCSACLVPVEACRACRPVLPGWRLPSAPSVCPGHSLGHLFLRNPWSKEGVHSPWREPRCHASAPESALSASLRPSKGPGLIPAGVHQFPLVCCSSCAWPPGGTGALMHTQAAASPCPSAGARRALQAARCQRTGPAHRPLLFGVGVSGRETNEAKALCTFSPSLSFPIRSIRQRQPLGF